MARPSKEPMEALNYIIEKRQPLSLRDVRYFGRCYVSLRDWTKDEMYAVIRENFNVDEQNKVTMK